MTIIFIQAEATGYQGPSVTVLGALDTDSGMVVISKELAHGDTHPGAVVISNDPRSERRDSLFTEQKLQTAIRLYFRAIASDLLELWPAVKKHDPQSRIETLGINELGTSYRLSPDLTNGNMAVLAVLDAADVAMNAQGSTEFARDLADMYGDEDYDRTDLSDGFATI